MLCKDIGIYTQQRTNRSSLRGDSQNSTSMPTFNGRKCGLGGLHLTGNTAMTTLRQRQVATCTEDFVALPRWERSHLRSNRQLSLRWRWTTVTSGIPRALRAAKFKFKSLSTSRTRTKCIDRLWRLLAGDSFRFSRGQPAILVLLPSIIPTHFVIFPSEDSLWDARRTQCG